MSDTVKLIIEIPTDLYEITKAKVDKNMTNTISAVSIANGIPLDNIKTEIEDLQNQNLFGMVSNYDLLNVVLEIIDKHIGGKE